MEQQVTIATEEFLKSQITQKDERILQLQQGMDSAHNRFNSTRNQLQAIIDSVHEWTLEEFSNGQLTESQAEELAQLVGFELTKEVEAIVTVEYSMTINVPLGEDAEDIINDIDFDAISYDTDNISYVNATVSSIDI